jgi:tagatose-6-phosphate ketose/aldose isomerase
MALVLDPSTNDRGLAMTSSFSNMVVAGQALGALSNLEDHERRLEEMARVAEDLLPRAAESAMHLAGQRFRRVCFLGSNALAATAMESALKVQELTAGRIFSMSQSFLGLRHGPLSFLNEETLVVAYLASGRLTRLYELDLLRELKKKRLGVTIAATGFSIAEPLAGIADVVHDLGPEGAVPDDLRPPLDVILGQMLGLFCSLQAGLTPDTPSPSGAISRVVSHLRIHTEQLVEGAR